MGSDRERLVMRRLQLAALTAGLFMLGCPAEPAVQDAGPRRDVGRTIAQPDAGGWNFTPFDAGPPPPEGHLEGRIETVDGEGVANVDILCCSPSTCLIYTTDETGTYSYSDIPIGPRKMKTFDHDERYRTTLWHQVVREEETTGLPRPIVMFEKQERTEWGGATVVLANGRLELTAPDSGIKFPIEDDNTVAAREVMPEQFPPLDVDPWGDDATGVLTFLLEPDHLYAEAPIGVVVKLGDVDLAGSVYDVWTVDDSTAVTSKVGTARVNAAGDLVTDADCDVRALDALAFVPQRG